MTCADLAAVDELCRLVVVARRLGCRIHLVGANAELRALLDLSGVADVVGECPAAADLSGSAAHEGDLR